MTWPVLLLHRMPRHWQQSSPRRQNLSWPIGSSVMLFLNSSSASLSRGMQPMGACAWPLEVTMRKTMEVRTTMKVHMGEFMVK
ncbi:hypothetical protein DAI22_11g168950 [Oryza sativa Japonica Group]|nr:hypothetical protein DAI22_11g168950 [Oryza sativa Japonica Group]